MADVPPFNDSPVYIFLQDLVVSPAKHRVYFPGMFWAWDPEGDRRLSDEEVDMHLAQFGSTLQDLTLNAYCRYSAKWKQYDYDVIREVHERLGFNPDTREVAEFMGYPPIEIDIKALAALNRSRSMTPQVQAETRPAKALLVIPYPTPAVTSAITFILGVGLAIFVSFYLQGGRDRD